jgi:hypothetical protein
MSFLRHGEIYPCDEGAISRPRPRSSPWMSLQLAIPGRLLSSRARFRFTSRSYTAHHQPRPTMLRQRTAKCSLTDCLSRGAQSKPPSVSAALSEQPRSVCAISSASNRSPDVDFALYFSCIRTENLGQPDNIEWSLSGTASGTARPCDFGSSGPLSGRLLKQPPTTSFGKLLLIARQFVIPVVAHNHVSRTIACAHRDALRRTQFGIPMPGTAMRVGDRFGKDLAGHDGPHLGIVRKLRRFPASKCHGYADEHSSKDQR